MPLYGAGGYTPLAVSKSLVIAECNTNPANTGSDVSMPLDTFYDETGTKLGTGAPTDSAVIAYLAAMGLSVDATGATFTVLTDGVFAVRVDGFTISGGPTTSAFTIWYYGTGTGISGFRGIGLQVDAAAPASTAFGTSLIDVIAAATTFGFFENGVNAETDLSYFKVGIARIR